MFAMKGYRDLTVVHTRRMRIRQLIAVLLALLCVGLPSQTYAQNGTGPLRISVVQGEGEIIDGQHVVDIVVRVTEVGATVTFTLSPKSGVTFPGGASKVTIKSDAQGEARSGALTAVASGGKFEVQVDAAYIGQIAVTTVHATNSVKVEGTKAASGNSRKLMWIAIIGGAAAAGVVVAMGKGGADSSVPATPGTITAGSPTVGAPQ